LTFTDFEIDDLLCQVVGNDAHASFPASLSPSDWERFIQRARRHGLAGLIYWEWKAHPPADCPDWVLEKLKRQYIHTLVRNRILQGELERILPALQQAEVEVILLKGALFCTELYEDLGLRPMSDLDILVRTEQIGQAVRAISALGYESVGVFLNKEQQQWSTHDVHLHQKGESGVDVEVHWSLASAAADRFQPEMDWFWETKQPDRRGRAGVYRLSPTATLLYLCAHLALQHGIGYGGLLWLVDITRYLGQEDRAIDWELAAEKAAAFQWSAALYYTLKECQTRLGLKLDERHLELFRNSMGREEEALVVEKSRPGQNKALLILQSLQGMQPQARVRALWSNIFPSPAFMRQRYAVKAGWLLPGYYPYRWIDALVKLTKGWWQRYRRERSEAR